MTVRARGVQVAFNHRAQAKRAHEPNSGSNAPHRPTVYFRRQQIHPLRCGPRFLQPLTIWKVGRGPNSEPHCMLARLNYR